MVPAASDLLNMNTGVKQTKPVSGTMVSVEEVMIILFFDHRADFRKSCYHRAQPPKMVTIYEVVVVRLYLHTLKRRRTW